LPAAKLDSAETSAKAPRMSSLSSRRVRTAPATRLVAIAGMVGAALLVGPVAVAASPVGSHPHHTGHRVSVETVEQRIRTLHEELKITPAEEANWDVVAQTMRDNEARMQSLIAENTAEPAHSIDAVENMKTYERFTQTHVDGLKTLISSFETLYSMMPDDQKHLADHVFQKFGHKREAQT
jgi:hypothetical protein